MKYQKNDQQAQVLLEYALVIGAVVLVLFAMGTMIQRASQGMVKIVADQIGNQADADQRFDDKGHLQLSNIQTRSVVSKNTSEMLGDLQYSYDESIQTDEVTLVNLGFTPDN